MKPYIIKAIFLTSGVLGSLGECPGPLRNPTGPHGKPMGHRSALYMKTKKRTALEKQKYKNVKRERQRKHTRGRNPKSEAPKPNPDPNVPNPKPLTLNLKP